MNSPCANPQPGQLLPKPTACCAACAQGRPCGSLGQAPATTPTPDFLTAHPWAPYAIVFGALAAGVGVAYAVSRPTKSVAEMAAEVANEVRRPRRTRRRR